ncbi:hypothetical protein [Lyngbya aestuarii]
MSHKFITTELIDKAREVAEKTAWDAVSNAFADRDYIKYCRYPIFC